MYIYIYFFKSKIFFVQSSKERFAKIGPADRYTSYITAIEALIAQPTNQCSLSQQSLLIII